MSCVWVDCRAFEEEAVFERDAALAEDAADIAAVPWRRYGHKERVEGRRVVKENGFRRAWKAAMMRMAEGGAALSRGNIGIATAGGNGAHVLSASTQHRTNGRDRSTVPKDNRGRYPWYMRIPVFRSVAL